MVLTIIEFETQKFSEDEQSKNILGKNDWHNLDTVLAQRLNPPRTLYQAYFYHHPMSYSHLLWTYHTSRRSICGTTCNAGKNWSHKNARQFTMHWSDQVKIALNGLFHEGRRRVTIQEEWRRACYYSDLTTTTTLPRARALLNPWFFTTQRWWLASGF